MKKSYYGLAAIAAIGGGLWWWLSRGAEAQEPDCLDDGDCPTGYICQGGICVLEGTGDFVVVSLTCEWISINFLSLTAVVSNVGVVGGEYTAILTGDESWRLDEKVAFIEAGSSHVFTWNFQPYPGTKTICLEDKCCEYTS